MDDFYTLTDNIAYRIGKNGIWYQSKPLETYIGNKTQNVQKLNIME